MLLLVLEALLQTNKLLIDQAIPLWGPISQRAHETLVKELLILAHNHSVRPCLLTYSTLKQQLVLVTNACFKVKGRVYLPMRFLSNGESFIINILILLGWSCGVFHNFWVWEIKMEYFLSELPNFIPPSLALLLVLSLPQYFIFFMTLKKDWYLWFQC